MDRRTVLSGGVGLATVGVAGCLDRLRSGDDLRYRFEATVQNDHDRSYDVRIGVIAADEEMAVEQSYTLTPGEGRSVDDDVPKGEYTVTVELADRSRLRSFWNTDLCDVHQVRTEIAADGHISHHAACLSEEGDPPWGQRE